MTQFKDKAARHADNVNAGLFTYPALMAADILRNKISAVVFLLHHAPVPNGSDIVAEREYTGRLNPAEDDFFSLCGPIFYLKLGYFDFLKAEERDGGMEKEGKRTASGRKEI